MADFYIESSALAKIYHREQGTERLFALRAVPDNRFYVSWLGAVEVHSMAARLVREGKVTAGERDRMAARLDVDLRDGTYVFHPLRVPTIVRTINLFRATGSRRPLRTLDALHLAVALDIREDAPDLVLVTADGRLFAAAADVGLPAIDPAASA